MKNKITIDAVMDLKEFFSLVKVGGNIIECSINIKGLNEFVVSFKDKSFIGVHCINVNLYTFTNIKTLDDLKQLIHLLK